MYGLGVRMPGRPKPRCGVDGRLPVTTNRRELEEPVCNGVQWIIAGLFYDPDQKFQRELEHRLGDVVA